MIHTRNDSSSGPRNSRDPAPLRVDQLRLDRPARCAGRVLVILVPTRLSVCTPVRETDRSENPNRDRKHPGRKSGFTNVIAREVFRR